MIYSKDALLDDLAVFADLGTDAPTVVQDNETLIAHFVRDGFNIELFFLKDGAVIERYDSEEKRYSNFRSLLASPLFSNLGKWASNQALHLKSKVSKETLPIQGRFSVMGEEGGVSFFDASLTNEKHRQSRVSVTLVNGPAGIGKTGLIRALAYRRARDYRRLQSPLILHVESRGRVLQNITDLMAFSLQTLRLSIMYDQIPVLVRNGLVTLAIDGFDELGDPNGYDLAWAQVNDLIVSCRGLGSLILAGRETFIGMERMESALTALERSSDTLSIYTLSPIRANVATKWLSSCGWPESAFDLEQIAPLFEDGSYALRPFFLSELAREGVFSQIEQGVIGDLFAFLVEAMIDRETKKFGEDIENATTKNQRLTFIRRLMEEVARDQAENQSDAIPLETIVWLSEMVAHDLVPENLVGILKNRAGVIAFLIDDDRRGYRRFAHEQISNFFLSFVTINAIVDGEIPKYIRRNIFGLDFLETFCSVFREISEDVSKKFIGTAAKQMKMLGDGDRAKRNLGSLLIAACSVSEPTEVPAIENLSLDDVYISESIHKITLSSVTIGQLYAREADFRRLDFQGECFIGSLIADEGTIPPFPFPVPNSIHLPNATLLAPDAKIQWLQRRFFSTQKDLFQLPDIGEILNRFGLFNLLLRLARFKPYWLKDGEDKVARRILDDSNWEKLKDLMVQHDLLVERRDVPASGRPAPFYHVKNRKDLQNLESPPAKIVPFLQALLAESLRQSEDSSNT